jgi:Cysteine rich repeat
MKTIKRVLVAFATSAVLVTGAWAQQGPVATACKDDIPKFCAGKEHGQGEVRACLEAHKDKVSAACKAALETTGGPGKAQ